MTIRCRFHFMYMQRTFILMLVATIVFAGCKSKKASLAPSDNTLTVNPSFEPDGFPDETILSEELIGVVTSEQKRMGCDLLVRVISNDDKNEITDSTSLFTATYLYPVQLDEKYRKDGLKIKFRYRPSRAFSGACVVGMPAIFEDVSLVD